MGGGNAQKSATARARNLEKAKKANKGSQLQANAKAMNVQCKTCLATFMSTSTEEKLKEHHASKHGKLDFYQCFPHLKA
jgi:hypothetical protein|eukprot:CAMPEP_0177751200 /NCGR_PEP_ID=MMETSP0491_2-20121128/243_1 /TAXON_ID=63592 /ORGANISM="Tetraselmis chuii, Strain PLY429" /LENGTH=78 /DNA_ID=CAMNT_0019266289 /DNA_START=667 /DNA_END=903 /DNA_ORIENTATION=-